MPAPGSLPPLTEQAERLIALGIHEIAGLTAADLRAVPDDTNGGLLVLHPDRAPAAALTPLLTHRGKAGFVVVDMADVDKFAPIPHAVVPASPVYLVTGVDRGDQLANWSPDEALPAITAAGRTPLLLTEGIHWVLQQPDALERNHCFMTIGSRLRKDDDRLDSRVPAIWISHGTGRDR